ncbi:Ger(x)C family spore germination protein [Cohnella zeiphila]|uniref:Ger(X)C family spore germination protein n=1 Tax=Cohnella zeiphila TaxID=2761120 RepID=A0A7X0SPG6_9BACL|nr:Ger(x)C family spore germination protein [Cohnella zeiphila]
MLRTARIVCLLSSLLFLAGCWDYREVHQIAYVTTIGVDYKDKQFTLYAQSLNFANIAQRESLRPPEHKAVVGHVAGATLTQAMFNLYQSELQWIYWGHISAIIFSREALEQLRIEQLVDSVNRFRELRYNVWVFGTDEPIERLLLIAPFFGYSPFDSRLMKPNIPFRQFSDIKPVYLNRFVSDYFERGKFVLLPKLAIDSSSWTEGDKNKPELKLNGVYVIAPRQYSGSLTEDQIAGKRYVDPKSVRMPLLVSRNESPAALLVVNSPGVRIRHEISGGKVIFDVRIRLTGSIDELLQDVKPEFLREEAEKTIEQKVRYAFEQGKKLNADVLNLTTPLYRYHYSTWKRMVTDKPDMRKIELRNVEVVLTIKNSGKYKARLQ